MAKQFTDANFQTDVIEASKSKPVLVDFYAEWCSPCKIQSPIIEEVARAIGEKAVVGKVNTEENMNISNQFNIMSIPTIMLFKGGGPVETFIGLQDKNSLVAVINKYL
jgi:thioredoxin 1